MRNAAEIAFLKTVELGSIRAAARALGQDPSGLSRRITQLEQRLGTKLVERIGNATTPTAQGLMYFERLKKIIDQLEELEAEVSGEELEPSGLLRVTSSIDFGQEYLTDWLLEFRQRHPSVDFDLTLAGEYVDLAQNGIDVAIRIGRLPSSSMIALKLADLSRVLVASPTYLDRMGRPERPEDLETHQFVFFMPRNRTEFLELIGPDGKAHKVKRTSGVSINAVRSAVKAVLADQGIHSGPRWAFANQIERGEVEVILPDYTQARFPLYAVRQPSTVVPARISRFIEFLSAKVKGLSNEP